MTISPGPTTASSVLNFAERVVLAPWSPSVIVPRAPRMSPTCASSSTAERPVPATSASIAVTEIHLFRAFTQAGSRHTLRADVRHSSRSPSVGPSAGYRSHHTALAGASRPDKIAIFAIRPARADIGGYGGRSPRVNGVCRGQAGTAAARADFGPDYQSPSHAS